MHLPHEARFAIVRALSPENAPTEVHQDIDDIRAFLIQRINILLENNMGLLMSALYRIDVSEDAVKQTFATAPPDQLAPRLADLIIKRQIQKIRIREKYK